MREGVTSGGVSRSAWMPMCWPYYVNPYEGKDHNYEGPVTTGPNPNTLALKPGTPALWVATCTPSLANSGYTIRKADCFVLRSVSAQIPVDFALPDRVSSAVLTLSLNNAWRHRRSDWVVMDPDMAGAADDLIPYANTRTAPVWTMNASLRLRF